MCDACTAKFGEFYRSKLCQKAQERFKPMRGYFKDAIEYQVFSMDSNYQEGLDNTIAIINDLNRFCIKNKPEE